MGETRKMRQSARLKSSGTLEKLKEVKFTNLDEEEYQEDEIVEEFSQKIIDKSSKSPPKTGKRGRPKKSTFSSDDDSFHDSDSGEDEVSCSESSISETKVSQMKKAIDLTLGKKKMKRTGGFLPPVDQFPGIKGNLLSSASSWVEFINEHNSNIKRKNRRFKTAMLEIRKDEDEQIKKIVFSPFQALIPNTKFNEMHIKLLENNNFYKLSTHSSIIDGKTGNINTGASNNCVCFCECNNCKSNAEHIFLFAGSTEMVLVFKAKISKKLGILSTEKVGTILPPKSESFKSICPHNSALSISTNRSLYFIDCKGFHNQSPLEIILNESDQLISDLSCHSWRGNHIAVGSLSGKVFVFNILMQEIFQISVISGSAIYSLDWIDEFTIVIGGNFSKIFSIDLRDPFLIEIVASTLATLPKVLWSQSINSVLFTDGENHARRLEKSNNNSLHQPIGTFDSMVLEMASSSLHNIIASACASGSIHLAWMADEPNFGVEFEKKVFSLSLTEDGRFESILEPEYVPFQLHDTIKLCPSKLACTSVAWCPNEHFPGLLAGGYRNGLLILMTTDRFFI